LIQHHNLFLLGIYNAALCTAPNGAMTMNDELGTNSLF